MEVVFETFFSLGFCGAALLLVSGFVFRSPLAARQQPAPTSPAFIPGLVVLFVLFGVVLFPFVHWDRVAAMIGGRP